MDMDTIAMIFSHEYFPTGKGLVLIGKEVSVLYYDNSTVHLFDTHEEYRPSLGMKAFMNDLYTNEKFSTQGVGHAADLEVILNDLTNEELGAIYTEAIGHNPFEDVTETITEDQQRKLCIDVISSDEFRPIIFGGE